MIVDLPDTTTGALSRRLVSLRAEAGAIALTRVLTLVVVTDDDQEAETALATASDASRQHPARIIAVVTGEREGHSRLDGQIRVGGDVGASEVIVTRLSGPLATHGRAVALPLLLADSPIVAWYPGAAPRVPAQDPIGSMASRRITDASHSSGAPHSVMDQLALAYHPGDTDLSWARITRWRAVLAASLDTPLSAPIEQAAVLAAPDSPSGMLLAGWLGVRLGAPSVLVHGEPGSGVVAVRLRAGDTIIDLVRPADLDSALMRRTGQPDRLIALPRRTDASCLADELRRLDPDEAYADALTQGVGGLHVSRSSLAEAVEAGLLPDLAGARAALDALAETPDAPPPSSPQESS